MLLKEIGLQGGDIGKLSSPAAIAGAAEAGKGE
jgi:hypothetical protein